MEVGPSQSPLKKIGREGKEKASIINLVQDAFLQIHRAIAVEHEKSRSNGK